MLHRALLASPALVTHTVPSSTSLQLPYLSAHYLLTVRMFPGKGPKTFPAPNRKEEKSQHPRCWGLRIWTMSFFWPPPLLWVGCLLRRGQTCDNGSGSVLRPHYKPWGSSRLHMQKGFFRWCITSCSFVLNSAIFNLGAAETVHSTSWKIYIYQFI